MDNLEQLLVEMDFDHFIDEIAQRSSESIGGEEWVVLRPLTRDERRGLDEINATWDELQSANDEARRHFTERRRRAVRSHRDLSDRELELLGRIRLNHDRYMISNNLLWSPLRYTYRQYEQIKLSPDKTLLLGRGHNRPFSSPAWSGVRDQNDRLRRLLG